MEHRQVTPAPPVELSIQLKTTFGVFSWSFPSRLATRLQEALYAYWYGPPAAPPVDLAPPEHER